VLDRWPDDWDDLVVPGTRQLLDKKAARWIFDTLLARGVLA